MLRSTGACAVAARSAPVAPAPVPVTSPMISLAELLSAYQAGDAGACAAFLEAARVLIARRVPPGDGDAGDLDARLDAVAFQVHKARHTWAPGMPVEPWLESIADHVLRASGRHRAAPPRSWTALLAWAAGRGRPRPGRADTSVTHGTGPAAQSVQNAVRQGGR